MIREDEVEKLASASRNLPPAESAHFEEDFVTNLLETVLDVHASDDRRDSSETLSRRAILS